MAKKNNTGITFGSDFDIDEGHNNASSNDEPINCLKKEKVIVRHIDRPTDLVSDKRHVLYGGMAKDAVRSYVVPKTQGNMYKNFLTTDEQACLENALGLSSGTLNPAKTVDNFWSEKQKNGFNRVNLHHQDNILDLSIPQDYIAYKILLSNTGAICPSPEVLEKRPKPTYEFVIISEDIDAKNAMNKLNNKKQAWMELGKIQDDVDRMRVVLSLLERKTIAPTTKIAFLQNRLSDFVDTDTKKFLDIVQDKYFDTRVTIQKALDRGIIIKKGSYYYDKESNSPLCEAGEDPTIANACKYLNTAKNDNVKFSLEAKLSAK